MIALQSDCLLFQLANGESVPCSAEMISFEISGGSDGLLEPEMLHHAAASVFHYFKVELRRDTVTVGEFAVRAGKSPARTRLHHPRRRHRTAPPDAGATDLGRLARESADSLELFFFPRLRNELRAQLRQSPRLVRFRGLRRCVKQLAGARRWSRAAKNCRTRLSSICAAASPPSRSKPGARWWWSKFSSANVAN